MTVIATFYVQGCPVILGDLLLTGPTEQGNRSVGLPALGDVQDFFEGSGWAIAGLKQKVVLISSHCVIAWAGSLMAASLVIEQLREMATKTALTSDSILSFLQSHPDLQQHQVSFVGWVVQGDCLGHFRYQAETFDGGGLGQIAMAGTGSQAVREFAGLFNSFDLLLMHQADAGQQALAAGLSMAASLLRSELHGADAAPTLRHMFGGGYEVAIFADGAFRKLGDLTFVIWEADVTDGIRLSHPQLILKQQYWNDILLIRSARIKTNDSKLELIDQQFHSVLPMCGVSKDIETEDLLKLSLQSDLTCHCFFVRDKQGLALYFYIDRCLPNTESTMTVEECEGVVKVMFSSKFTQQVVANILS